jgi:hypothetical protein
MNETIKIGDEVMWRGNFNNAPAMLATVTAIDLGAVKRSKYGTPVTEVPVALKDFCCFSLDNHHWAYGEQITAIDMIEVAAEYELYYTY